MFLVFDGPEAGKARFQGVQIGELTVSLTSSQYLFAVQNSEGVPNLHLDATVPDAVIANLVKATAQDIDG